MKDEEGRGFFQRRKEQFLKKSMDIENEQKKALGKALRDQAGNNTAELMKFLSFRSILRAMLPQLIIGTLIAIVEYELVGFTYTLASIAIYVPIIYVYSKTLRRRRTKQIFVPAPQRGNRAFDILSISEEIWELIKKEEGLTIAVLDFNGRDTIVCERAEFIANTLIPTSVKEAWSTFNYVEFMLLRPLLEKLTDLVKEMMLENTELTETMDIKSIVEAKRQTKETIESITSAHLDSIMAVLKKIETTTNDVKTKNEHVLELLNDPRHLDEVIKKEGGDEE